MSVRPTDTITVLRSHGRRLAKMIRANGIVQAYDDARTFDMFERPVRDLDALAALLVKLLPRPDCAIVRGAINDPARTQSVRRLVHPDRETGDPATLRERPHCWVALDLDELALPGGVDARDLMACAAAARAALPPDFGAARAVVTATASHGIKAGMRLRYWCWCSRPLSGPELDVWLRNAPVDRSVFRPTQPIYTAAPVFEAGAADPVPTRIVLLDGAASEVVTPPTGALAPPPPPRRLATHSSGLGDRNRQIAAMIGSTLARLEMAGQGQKHDRLRAAARTLGGLLDEGAFTAAEAEQALFNAVTRAGGTEVVEKSARATIAWGLERGRRSPILVGDR